MGLRWLFATKSDRVAGRLIQEVYPSFIQAGIEFSEQVLYPIAKTEPKNTK